MIPHDETDRTDTYKSQRRRPSREDLFMEVAHMFAERSTCERAQVGVVAVKENRIIALGYNGAPSGMPHCLDVGCQIVREVSHELDSVGSMPVIKKTEGIEYQDVVHCVRASHAEANLVAHAARTGTPLLTSDLYCTHQPCFTCSKLLINAGIAGIHYCEEYGSPDSIALLREAGVLVWHEESC